MKKINSMAGGDRLGYIILAIIGGGLFLVNLYHTTLNEESVITILSGIVLPLLLSIAVLGCSYWVWRHGFSGEGYRIGIWSALGGAFGGLTGGLLIIYLLAENPGISHTNFIIANMLTYGAFVGVIIGAYDGDRAQQGAKLRSERTRADRLNRRLSVLNRILRHDIRNRMTLIKGYTEQLPELSETEPVDGIRRETEQLLEVSTRARQLQDLFDPSESKMQTISISDLVKDAVSTVRAVHPDAEITLTIQSQREGVAHPLLESAIEELLVNAIEHAEVEEPSVDIKVFQQGDEVAVDVCDNGPGIPEEELSVLEAEEEDALSHSSGIGLWFVYWVVSDFGGTLDFRDNTPTGACVRVEVPIAETP